MSEETILKSSFFGGYNKEEVNQFVDSVVEENDKRLKGLQEQIAYLTKENSQLKNQLDAEKTIKPKISDKNDRPKYPDAHENKQTAPNAFADLNGNQEKLPVRQQMELPEGIYIVSEDQSIVSLPEPLPVYRTKGKNNSSNAMSEIKRDAVSEASEETKTFRENAAYEEAADAGKIGEEESVPMRRNATSSEDCDKQEAREAALPSQKSCLPKDITEMQNELLSVKALLEKERHEKQMLAAKLEFSNDLLIQLYQK